METTLLISAVIFLFFLSLYKEIAIKRLESEKDDKDNIIELQKDAMNNYSETIKHYQSILEKGITINSDKPKWLSDELSKEVRDLWNSSNTAENYNPRVKAAKLIQQKYTEANLERKLSIQDASDIIKKYCL